MKVLISGAAGYIGSTLCDMLTQLNCEVIGVDNFLWNNQGAILHLLNRPNFTFHKMDAGEIPKELLDVNYAVLLHALVGAPLCDKDPAKTKKVNVDSIARLMEITPKQVKVLFPNSNSSYGTNPGITTEESPTNPLSLYAQTKMEAEKIVLERGNCFVGRLATVMGSSSRPRMDLMVNNFVYRLYFHNHLAVFQPELRRNFVGIKDVCRAFMWAFDPKIEGVYNVGLDEANCTKLELAERLKQIVNPNATIEIGTGEDPDKRDYNISSQKLMNTGFEFKEKLADSALRVKKMCEIIGPSINELRNY